MSYNTPNICFPNNISFQYVFLSRRFIKFQQIKIFVKHKWKNKLT